MAGVHLARVPAEFNHSGGITPWNGDVESSVLKNNNVGLHGGNGMSIASSAIDHNATGLHKVAASGNHGVDKQIDLRELRAHGPSHPR